MNTWITILTFTYPHKAHMAKGYLESNGIEVIIKDELTAQVNNFYSNAIGGVKLLIKESNFEAAKEILIKGGYIDFSDKKTEIETIKIDKSISKNTCPYCQSKNIAKIKDPSLLVVIVYFILGAIFPIFRAGYQCFDCEKKWKFKRK